MILYRSRGALRSLRRIRDVRGPSVQSFKFQPGSPTSPCTSRPFAPLLIVFGIRKPAEFGTALLGDSYSDVCGGLKVGVGWALLVRDKLEAKRLSLCWDDVKGLENWGEYGRDEEGAETVAEAPRIFPRSSATSISLTR